MKGGHLSSFSCVEPKIQKNTSEGNQVRGIRLDDVHFAWSRTRPILKGVSFYVPPGQFCMLFGSNGCGKSTLCEVIVGLLIPHRGRVHIDRPVGLICQNPDDNLVFPTVDLEFSAGLKNKSLVEQENITREALRCIGLEHLYHSRVDGLSGGEKQRIALASLLLLNPLTIILDEPTASMDAASRTDFLMLIKQHVVERNIAILWVTHLIEELNDADRILKLQSGRIVYDGHPCSAVI
eukprot:jgi/Galph1/1634/GphlegSOOS_G311.1